MAYHFTLIQQGFHWTAGNYPSILNIFSTWYFAEKSIIIELLVNSHFVASHSWQHSWWSVPRSFLTCPVNSTWHGWSFLPFFAWFPNSIRLWFPFHLTSSSFISFAYRRTVSNPSSWFSLSCPLLTHCLGDLIHLHGFPYHQHMDNFHLYESRPNISTELEFHITVLLFQSAHMLWSISDLICPS